MSSITLQVNSMLSLKWQVSLKRSWDHGKSYQGLYLGSTDRQYYSIFLFFFFVNLFIYFCLRWVFIAAHGLSLVAVSGGYSSLRCAGFSLRWLLLLWSMGSRHAGFSSCDARAQLLRGMWGLPGPGLEPVSPALAGGFLTTVPPGKSLQYISAYRVMIKVRRQLLSI